MEYGLKAARVRLTAEQKAYLEEKMLSLEKLTLALGTSVKCWVEIEKTTRHHRTGNIYRAEIQFHVPKKRLVAEALGGGVLEAIDLVKDKMLKELRTYKSKATERKRELGSLAKERRLAA